MSGVNSSPMALPGVNRQAYEDHPAPQYGGQGWRSVSRSHDCALADAQAAA